MASIRILRAAACLEFFRHQRRFSDASLAAHDDSTANFARTLDQAAQNV
jgi:hypothetical protein